MTLRGERKEIRAAPIRVWTDWS